MTIFEMYLFTRLNILNVVLGVGACSCLACGAFGFIIGKAEDSECAESVAKRLLITGAICLSLWIPLPTERDAALMYVVPYITQNKDVQEIPQNILKLVNSKLKEWVKEEK